MSLVAPSPPMATTLGMGPLSLPLRSRTLRADSMPEATAEVFSKAT